MNNQQSAMADQRQAHLAQRYGATRKRFGDRAALFAGGGVLVLVVAVFIGSLLANQSVTNLSFADVSYRVESDTNAELVFTITSAVAADIECELSASNASHLPVGYKIVPLKAEKPGSQTVTAHIRTTMRASAVTVSGCWIK